MIFSVYSWSQSSTENSTTVLFAVTPDNSNEFGQTLNMRKYLLQQTPLNYHHTAKNMQTKMLPV